MTRSTAILFLSLAMMAGCADAEPAGLDSEPVDGFPQQVPEDRYIVVLAASARADDVARGHGIRPEFVYSRVFNGFAAKIPPQAHAGLSRNPHVERIERDAAVVSSGNIQDGATWGLDRIDQRGSTLDGRYAYDYTGAGVTVYIVDSGIRFAHEEFEGRAVPGMDVFEGDGSDCFGHGTHVAGTVGSRTYGVAKDVRLVSVRVLDCKGSGMVSGLIAGLEWAASQGERPAVVNLSLGTAAHELLDEAIRRVIEAGITVVAAAGNNYADACAYSPGRVPDVITTGAMDPNGGRSVFSNYGACVDLFAPGRFITSTSFASDVAFTDMAGTSMAAPHVAGAAALVLEASPAASPATVAATIASRATAGVVAKSSTRNNDLLYTLDTDDSGNRGGGNEAPAAAFTYSCTGLSCAFTDRSADRDGNVVSWTWSLGDGSQSSQQHPTRTYASAGRYAVTLTVTDNDGATGSTTQEVYLQEPPSSTPPTASFGVACTDLHCTFSDQSTPVAGSLVRWEWDFGDGSVLSMSAAPVNPAHSYPGPGSYQVRLTVVDEFGAVGEATREVVVDGISLSAQAARIRGSGRIDLSWSGAAGASVRIVLNGADLATVPNTGEYRHEVANRSKSGYSFQVCETSGTRCSAEVSVKL